MLISATASAKSLYMERECFNARNGETYFCKIYDDMSAEIINDYELMLTKTVELPGGKTDADKYIKQLKSDKNYDKVVASGISSISPEFKDTYTFSNGKKQSYIHRGMKQYSVYVDGKKVSYLKVVPVIRKSGPHKLGSNEYKLGTNKVSGKYAYNQLRFATDKACAQATGTVHTSK
jgi:hypothetical protein